MKRRETVTVNIGGLEMGSHDREMSKHQPGNMTENNKYLANLIFESIKETFENFKKR